MSRGPDRMQMLQSIAWSADRLRSTVSTEAGDPHHAGGALQVEYLGRHLGTSGLNAHWILIERSYRDRYFIDEYTTYYARCQQPCQTVCTRLHFFTGEESLEDLPGLIESALAEGSLTDLEGDLRDRYLGFVVVRPIPSVPIGRTVLRPLPNQKESIRHFPGLRDYGVHLCGLHLRVRGVAFQQQDQAVGACATTAMWSALQIALPRDGMRPPTPAALTVAANRHLLVGGRPFPAALGLTVEQMCEALRASGTDPVVFAQNAGVGAQVLEQLLLISLKSGLPAILAIQSNSGGHAVTAVGYRASRPATLEVMGRGLEFRHGHIERLYIQDDRLGPYARAVVLRQEDRLYLEIPFRDANGELRTERSVITQMIVPQYPKLRATALDLIWASTSLLPLFEQVANSLSRRLQIEARFARSGEILRELRTAASRPDCFARFLTNARLSRYTGVVKLYLDDRESLTVLLDATDMFRKGRPLQQVLGFVAVDPDLYSLAELLGEKACRPVG